jgi:hypothetical protein
MATGFNDAAMAVAANALIGVLAYGQLHSADAGPSYTANLTSAPRQLMVWTAPGTLGSFGLAVSTVFTGGGAGNPVASLTLWNASSGGTCWGQFVFTSGDVVFNSSGTYTVTAIDLTGTAS